MSHRIAQNSPGKRPLFDKMDQREISKAGIPDITGGRRHFLQKRKSKKSQNSFVFTPESTPTETVFLQATGNGRLADAEVFGQGPLIDAGSHGLLQQLALEIVQLLLQAA